MTGAADRTNRQVLLLDLKDDPELIAQYEACHAPGAVPPKVVKSIRDAGIGSMEIFRLGDRLVMLVEVAEGYDPEAKAAADATDPAVVEWEARMDAFQQRLPWAADGEKWLPATRIFSLEEQP